MYQRCAESAKLGTSGNLCPFRSPAAETEVYPFQVGSLIRKGSSNSLDNSGVNLEENRMRELGKFLWHNEEGQDIAEYAVMLAVILVIVIGTVRLIGSNANTVFSTVASSISN